MKQKLKYITLLPTLLFPLLASAQTGTLSGVRGFLNTIAGFFDRIIGIIVGLAFIYFFWGMGQFILHAGDAKTRGDGKQRMLWGVIALFVIFSIYGIIRFIGGIFGITPGGSINIMTGIIT